MVSRCVAKEVQRNAKWGLLCGKRERAGREKRVSKAEKESEWGGKEEWVRWKGRVGEVERESRLDRKRKYHPNLCARVIL